MSRVNKNSSKDSNLILKNKIGKMLEAQMKYIVENVRAFFENEKSKGYMKKWKNVIDRLSEATGISQRWLRNIHTEFLANDGKFLSPINCYTASRVRINTDSFDREAIGKVVHDFYIKKEYPTLSAVLEKVRTDGIFHGGRFCLWKLFRSMGFSYIKADNKRFLYKQHDIIEQRHTYLQAIR